MKKYVLLTACLIVLCLLLTTTNTNWLALANPVNGQAVNSCIWEIGEKEILTTLDDSIITYHWDESSPEKLTLYRQSLVDGHHLWKKPVTIGTAKGFDPYILYVHITDNHIYLVHRYYLARYEYSISSESVDIIQCIDKQEGNIVWSINSNDFETVDSKNSIFYSKIHNEKLYCMTASDKFFVIDTDKGEIVQRFRKPESYGMFSTYFEITNDNTKLLLSSKVVECFNISDPEKPEIIWDTIDMWESHGTDYREKYPRILGIVDNNVIFCGHDKNNKKGYFSIFCRDINTGEILWKNTNYSHGERIYMQNDLIVHYDFYDILTNYGKLYEKQIPSIKLYDSSNGKLIWEKLMHDWAKIELCDGFRIGYKSFLYPTYSPPITFKNEDNSIIFAYLIGNKYEYKVRVTNLNMKTNYENWQYTFEMKNKIPLDYSWYGSFWYSNNYMIYDNVCYPIYEKYSKKRCKPITILKFTIDVKKFWHDKLESFIDASPTIQNYRTYIPARYVTEPLGGQVFWDASERKVTCKLADKTVELWIGKSTAKLNGVEIQIDPNNPAVTPTIINDRTMVPMRFLAESLGCEIKWIADTKEIILTYTP